MPVTFVRVLVFRQFHRDLGWLSCLRSPRPGLDIWQVLFIWSLNTMSLVSLTPMDFVLAVCGTTKLSGRSPLCPQSNGCNKIYVCKLRLFPCRSLCRSNKNQMRIWYTNTNRVCRLTECARLGAVCCALLDHSPFLDLSDLKHRLQRLKTWWCAHR